MCKLGSGGAMCLGCVKRSTAQLSVVARVLASLLQLALFVQDDLVVFNFVQCKIFKFNALIVSILEWCWLRLVRGRVG